MPMTARQLEQVAVDYADFIGHHSKVVSCRTRCVDDGEPCDLCHREAFGSQWEWEARKEIVVHAGPAVRYRLVVCRNGVKCRQRALARAPQAA